MPEPQVLYTVVAVVLAALVVWVVMALKTAKEPWARPVAAATGDGKDAAAPAPEAAAATSAAPRDEHTEEPAPDEPKDA